MTAVQVRISTTEYQEPSFGWYEVYADQTHLLLANVVANAAFSEIAYSNAFIHGNLNVGDTWHYWIRPVYRIGSGISAGALKYLGSKTLASLGGGITQLTGDVTAGPGTGSQVATIGNNKVTYAKMQDVSATSRIIGRKTAGGGDPEELTLSETLDFIGSAAQGDILYRGSSSWARLAAGTSGQFLKTLGAGANPAWDTPSGGGGGSSMFPTFTSPVDGDFAWVNQGGATKTVNANGSIALYAPATGSGSLRVRKKALPGGNYTLEAAFVPVTLSVNFMWCGLCLRDSGSSKLITYCAFQDGTFGDCGFVKQTWNDPTTFSASSVYGGLATAGGLVYMQLTDNGTNRIWKVGKDGYNYPITILTESRTTHLTANEAGFFVAAQNGTYDAGMTLYHWTGV